VKVFDKTRKFIQGAESYYSGALFQPGGASYDRWNVVD
jgi:hypothetical protein